MATRSDLRTRLQRRLGLGVVSSVEEDRLNEALNSGVARAVSDGVPGLTYATFIGSVLGSLSLTTAAAAARSATVTMHASTTLLTEKVMPHDILTFDTAGTQYLVQDVLTNTTLNIGALAPATIAAEAATITRRSLILPSTGQVISVTPEGNNSAGLTREPSSLAESPLKRARQDTSSSATPKTRAVRSSRCGLPQPQQQSNSPSSRRNLKPA